MCYTTLLVNQALKETLEQKYPWVRIEYHRAASEALAQRMLVENQVKRHDVDRLDGTSTIVIKSVAIRSV